MQLFFIMRKLVLIRHGESQWNKENKFTGWTDVDLTAQGIKEAKAAGQLLKKEGYSFDIAYTSVLKRAIRTLWLVLDEMNLMWIPINKSWRLNERHYGALQGLNKKETAKKHGEETVFKWRRSYGVCPPKLEIEDPRFPGNDSMYSTLKKSDLPRTECLKHTIKRVLPYWDTITKEIKSGKRVIIAAHGNSLRAIVKHLDNISDEEITNLNIPTGIPLIYDLDDKLKPVRSYYLGDPEKIRKASEKVKNQGKGE